MIKIPRRKKGPRPKAPVGKYRKAIRTINKKKRWVKVRRNADGTETVRILHPKNKKK